jgi:putative membrane protein
MEHAAGVMRFETIREIHSMNFTIATFKKRIPFTKNPWLWTFLGVFTVILANSFIGTTDTANWCLENTLTVLFIVFLIATFRRYQFSDLSYLLICIYLCLHVYGAKYTYAENPFGYWLQDVFDSPRNHYDRIVHFSFGLLLAYPMRELFLRWLKFPKMVAWILPIEITLSISALYELIEWGVADVFFKAQGDAYLGTQGDIWDAQKDIFLAICGAIIATTIVSLTKRFFYSEDMESV